MVGGPLPTSAQWIPCTTIPPVRAGCKRQQRVLQVGSRRVEWGGSEVLIEAVEVDDEDIS
jgi:hypothetical protein